MVLGGLILWLATTAFANAACGAQAAQPTSVTSQHPREESTATERQAIYRRAFEIVWRTVKEKHYDPDFGGIDWDRVGQRYAPLVDGAQSEVELYRLLQQMLSELGQSHFNILAPELAMEAPDPTRARIGIAVKAIGDEMVITRVLAGSPAEESGLSTGFAVVEVGGHSIFRLTARIQQLNAPEAIKRRQKERLVLARLTGTPATKVALVCLDGQSRRRSFEVERRKMAYEMSSRFANLPPMAMEFEARRLSGGIGYIRFNLFVMPLMAKIRNAIRSMSGAPGVIIDIRGNPGGIGGMAPGIAGLLEERETSLGRMQLRSGYQNFSVFPQKGAYRGPVVIIIDEACMSTGEIFAAGMKETGRATIVGERSAGAALPSIIKRLPTGALFQYAVGDFTTPLGNAIEGSGVEPDVAVPLTRAELLRGRDPQLVAAIEQITSLVRIEVEDP